MSVDTNQFKTIDSLVLRETIKGEDTTSFSLSSALNGNTVCIPNTNFKGQLIRQENNVYSLIVNGIRYPVSSDGTVESGEYKGQKLSLVNSTLRGIQGDTQTRASADGTESVSISSMSPRDEFAMTALKAIMEKQKSPESTSDGTIQLCCEAAYRWAQGMLEASAKARKVYKEEEHSQDAVDVNVETLNNNSDKILYNINESLKTLNKDNKASATATNTSVEAIKTALQGTLKIDNPLNDKFEINGGGGEGGWPSKDQLLNITTNDISGIVAFKNNAVGYAERSSIVDIAKSDGLWARSYTDGTTFISRNSSNISAAINQWTTTKIDDAINKLITDYGLTKPQ